MDVVTSQDSGHLQAKTGKTDVKSEHPLRWRCKAIKTHNIPFSQLGNFKPKNFLRFLFLSE